MFKFGFTGRELGDIADRWKRERALKKQLGLPMRTVFLSPEQVHSAMIAVIDFVPRKSAEIVGFDGLIYQKQTVESVGLFVKTADCYPVILYNESQALIAAIHCGWRGTVAGIIANTVSQISALSVKPNVLKVAIGPGIGSCCFEVKSDVLPLFSDLEAKLGTKIVEYREGATKVNLLRLIYFLFLEAGVKRENISYGRSCTFCQSEKYFSHRRKDCDGGSDFAYVLI